MLPLHLSKRFVQRCFPPANRLLTSATTTTTGDRRSSSPNQPPPPPIQVLLTESAGRGVFATRSIEPGQLIHTAKPLVSHPSISSVDKVCYLCLKNTPKCSEFQVEKVVFCSEECREQAKGFYEVEKEADWSALIAYCRTRGLKYPFLAKRLACMVISGVTSAECLDILQPARLSAEMISQMEEELCLLRGAFEDSGMNDKQLTFLNIEWYAGVLARIRINAFRIELAANAYEDLLALAAASVESEASVGNAVYMLPSFYNHDCGKTLYSSGFYEVEKEADWSALIAYCRTRGLKYPFLAKRLACMVISGVTSAECLDILQPARLSVEMISQMEEELCLLRGAFEDSGMNDKQLTFLNIEWYAGVLARIRINAFRIELAAHSYEDLLALAAASVESEASVGNAVYMLPSFYNHDCDPNTHIVWVENVEARLKALREIEAGEELRICYIDASMDRDARQNLLSKGFGFECNCPRCMSND
ncbi:hypothetical protein SSX86_000855 [Deinandra increscens subsp. villosa]|uniref:SET domain-containing protein n=1 Tax=Deinandra increscens subsp. villosa TaxID=3103831 RepID=A0AAP0HDZ3_9ASTR